MRDKLAYKMMIWKYKLLCTLRMGKTIDKTFPVVNVHRKRWIEVKYIPSVVLVRTR